MASSLCSWAHWVGEARQATSSPERLRSRRRRRRIRVFDGGPSARRHNSWRAWSAAAREASDLSVAQAVVAEGEDRAGDGDLGDLLAAFACGLPLLPGRVAQLVGRRSAAYARGDGEAARLDTPAAGQACSRVGPSIGQNSSPTGSSTRYASQGRSCSKPLTSIPTSQIEALTGDEQ